VIVLDASVMVDLLTKEGPQTAHIRARLAGELDVHVPHLVDAEVTNALRGLVFRDRLRTNETDRELYERTKRDLAKRTWKYTQDYADAKTEVVEEILARR